MPKEVFPDARGPWTYATEWADKPGPDGNPLPLKEVTNDLALEVGWGIETIVHVATVNRGGLDAAQGWFVELDRAAINRLIKALRKARDQAFGVDE